MQTYSCSLFFSYLGALGMFTTLTVASLAALTLNKIKTGNFFENYDPPLEGTTWYDRLDIKDGIDDEIKQELSKTSSIDSYNDEMMKTKL